MSCTVCEQLKDKTQILYEDEQSVAVLGDAILGHIKIYPKKHAHKIEDLDDTEVKHLMTVANYAASVAFETLAAQGTNLIVNASGHDEHLCVEIIPRTMNDDLNLQWQPQTVEEEETKDALERIKEKVDYLGAVKKEKKVKEEKDVQKETGETEENTKKKNKDESKEEKYRFLHKHLERSP